MTAGFLRFVRATEEQINRCQYLEWPHWGSGLSWRTFQVREGAVRDLVGQNIHFVLVDSRRSAEQQVKAIGGAKAETEEELPSWLKNALDAIRTPANIDGDVEGDSILAACQLFHRTGTCNGKVYRGWCLANVFVQQGHRQKGYGQALKVHVDDWLKHSQTDFCCLYSEVLRFYEPEFTMVPTAKVEIPATDTALDAQVKLMRTEQRGLHLDNPQLRAFCQTDCLECLMASPSQNTFTILPEYQRYEFFFVRERCAAHELQIPPLSHHGAYVVAAGEEYAKDFKESYATWHANFLDKKLWLLRIRDNGNKEDRLLLLQAAQKTAFDAGLTCVMATGDELDDLQGIPGTQRQPCHESWPGIAYYNEELKQAHWINRQKFAWS